MTTWKNFKTTKTTKIIKNNKKIGKESEKKERSNSEKVITLQKKIKIADEDKMLEKIEKYVDKNREKTSQEMIERKNKRPAQNFKEWDLEVMISRIDAESKPKEKVKETSKWILYLIYTIIIIAIIAYWIKYFFNSNMTQIS